MLNLERRWFEAVPWETVVTVNEELCQKGEQPHAPNPKGYEVARQLWEESAARSMKLRQVLEVCRQIHKLAPFQFFNGNTVGHIVKVMVGEMLQPLPSVQAQIARSTVSHFVVGQIKAGELEDVFKHFGPLWRNPPPASNSSSGPPG